VPKGLPPNAITTAYGFPTSGGSGETIAIVDAYDDPTISNNLTTFSNQYGLPTCTITNGCFTKVNQNGGTTSFPTATSGWGLETSLDVEWAHALAPQAHILLVEATSNNDTNLFVAVNYASQHAQYVSMSWGGSEFTGETTFDADFNAFPSVSYFAASGDSGSSRVVYPSASPDVTSVGGTTLTLTMSTYAWEGESAWSKGGGGCSIYEQASAAQATYPSYDQTGATCNGLRATPDVALDANPTTGVSVYDTMQLNTGLGNWLRVGGTSASAVLWAARSAVARVQVTPTYIYGDNVPYYNVTAGGNGQQCVTGYNLCAGLGSWNQSHGLFNTSLSFETSSQTLVTGQRSKAMALNLSSPAPAGGIPVTLSSSSAGGGFSSSPNGPFNSTWSLNIASGANLSGTFYYRDTKAGSPVLTASSQNLSPTTQTETVNAGSLARITITPASTTLSEGATQSFTAAGVDQYTNPVAGFAPTWTTTSSGGTFSQLKGSTTTFTAGNTAGSGAVTATQSGVHGTASVVVKSPALQFETPPQALVAGQPSTAMDIQLSSSAPPGGVSVSLVTSSSAGSFSTSSSGTFGHTLSVNIAAGTTLSGPFYYRDTKAGSPQLTASGPNVSSASQTETVNPGSLARITVTPASVTLNAGASQSFSAAGLDQYTNPVTNGFAPTWTTTSSGGTFSQSKGTTTTFTAAKTVGIGVVTATQGSVHGTSSVTVTTASPKPAAVVNSSTWMDVFYNSSGTLMNAWWQSTSGWHDQALTTGIIGSPAAVVNSSTWMDVFYNSSGNLMNAWWQSTSGWHYQQIASGMVGSPVVISRTATSMDVFYESTSGQLMNAYWGAKSGWRTQVLATGIAGTPSAIANSATWMDVFYESTSGQLMNAWWQSASGWHVQALASGMAGNPSSVVNSSTWMDVFYESTSGQLMNAWWQSASGWHVQALASGMAGAPTSIARTATSMDAFYQSTSGKLMNAYWGAKTGWRTQSLASGMAGAPAAVANSATWMDVFYQNASGKLVNAWWQSASGWHVQTLP